MPVKPLKVKVINGTVMPNRVAITSAINGISRELKADSAAMKLFTKDPELYLSNKGLSIDIRREVLTEAGFKVSLAAGKCDYTCICTGCSFTKNSIADDLIKVYPAAKASLNKVLTTKIQ